MNRPYIRGDTLKGFVGAVREPPLQIDHWKNCRGDPWGHPLREYTASAKRGDQTGRPYKNWNQMRRILFSTKENVHLDSSV